MSLDRSKYYGHWVPLSCYDIRRLKRTEVESSDTDTRKDYALRQIHFYNNIHPITHVRLTGSIMSVNVNTVNNDLHGKLLVTLEVDDGSGELVTASCRWAGDMQSVRAKYEKLLHKTVSVRGTPYTRKWNDGNVVCLDLKAVDLLDFAAELEAIDNRMYTLEQLNLPPGIDHTRELPADEQPETRFLDYEVLSFQNAVSFTDVDKGILLDKIEDEKEERDETGKGKEVEQPGKEGKGADKQKDKHKVTTEQPSGEQEDVSPQYPNLSRLFKLPSAGKVHKDINIPQEIVLLDDDEDGEDGDRDAPGHQQTGEVVQEMVELDESAEVEEIENAEEQAIETSGEQAEEQIEEPVRKTVAKPAEKSVEEPAEQLLEGPFEEPAEETVEDTVEDSAEEPTVEHPHAESADSNSSDDNDEFGIMNKFHFIKTSSDAEERSSSPIVVDLSSSNSKDSSQNSQPEAGTTAQKSPKRVTQSAGVKRPKPKVHPTFPVKFKYSGLASLKRRRYTPDTA
ncbi:hypothetical protein CJU89_1909 [Yarrowia sp. B02]|nr:hypothetical protein CJU89_1909 [Yarrowia sp. B02]